MENENNIIAIDGGRVEQQTNPAVTIYEYQIRTVADEIMEVSGLIHLTPEIVAFTNTEDQLTLAVPLRQVKSITCSVSSSN